MLQILRQVVLVLVLVPVQLLALLSVVALLL
jgi:hypothetical protein